MGLISQLLSDPRATLVFFLLALPGRLLAISAHEAAHGWVAEKCGDPTARQLGRITLNPLRHLDITGLLMMLLVGIGWAKPVPVNPRNFRHYRRDDLLVSIAGITMNLILFVLSALIVYGTCAAALARVDTVSAAAWSVPEYFKSLYGGEMCYFFPEDGKTYYVAVRDLLAYAPYYADELIVPAFGRTAGYLFQMAGYSMITNMMLAIFNLIPLPPLDGYHVLNDLVLRRPLFADRKGMMVGSGIMVALFATGLLDKGLTAVSDFVFSGVGQAAARVMSMLGIL